jgi:hypothetical protein
MLLAAIHQTPTLTRERYEEVVFRLTGKRRAEAASDFPFGGLLVHVAVEDPKGFLIFDVWESEAAVEGFQQAIESIPQAVGIEEPPRFSPMHTYIVSDAAVRQG